MYRYHILFFADTWSFKIIIVLNFCFDIITTKYKILFTPLNCYNDIKPSDALETFLHTDNPTVTIMRNGSVFIKASTPSSSSIMSDLQSLIDVSVLSTTDDIGNASKGTILVAKAKGETRLDIMAHSECKHFPVTEVYWFPSKDTLMFQTHAFSSYHPLSTHESLHLVYQLYCPLVHSLSASMF